jgi:hypothetical protein
VARNRGRYGAGGSDLYSSIRRRCSDLSLGLLIDTASSLPSAGFEMRTRMSMHAARDLILVICAVISTACLVWLVYLALNLDISVVDSIGEH